CPSMQPKRRVANKTGAWMTAEALLWFPQVRSTVPLVSTNAAGTLPELDLGAATAFGGQDAFGGDLQAGFRLDGGVMLSEDFGMGGRFWMLGEAEDSYSASGDGTTGSIGIPFFDSDLVADQENSILVAYSDGTGGGDTDFQGNINVESTLEMYGAEGYGRLRLLGGKGYRSDFIGGFSHFGIEESLTLAATATQTEIGAGQGDVYTFNDDITAENEFFGGQIGFLTTVGRGAWTLTALTKVHLGNMDQTWTSNGSRGRTGFADQAGGIFANNAEQSIEQSNFSFAPEANIKLAYKLRPHVSFSVGYSFIMWDDVLLVGDNLNRNINSGYLVLDGAGAVDPAERPTFEGLETDSLFVHGVDLGCVIQF
ncbi:BBP7 family outer membrane beta-barrel protein, partial [Rhodopirellula sallentina]